MDSSTARMVLSFAFLAGSVNQLLLFCWSCHKIIDESLMVSEAAYGASWYYVEQFKNDNSFKKAVAIMMMRARRPCIITVGKFTPMSLQTFASVRYLLNYCNYTFCWWFEFTGIQYIAIVLYNLEANDGGGISQINLIDLKLRVIISITKYFSRIHNIPR